MESSLENTAVLAVLRRWMPALHREAIASGQDEDALLERALSRALPRTEVVDISEMAAEADASGYEEVEDLNGWHAELEEELRASLA